MRMSNRVLGNKSEMLRVYFREHPGANDEDAHRYMEGQGQPVCRALPGQIRRTMGQIRRAMEIERLSASQQRNTDEARQASQASQASQPSPSQPVNRPEPSPASPLADLAELADRLPDVETILTAMERAEDFRRHRPDDYQRLATYAERLGGFRQLRDLLGMVGRLRQPRRQSQQQPAQADADADEDEPAPLPQPVAVADADQPALAQPVGSRILYRDDNLYVVVCSPGYRTINYRGRMYRLYFPWTVFGLSYYRYRPLCYQLNFLVLRISLEEPTALDSPTRIPTWGNSYAHSGRVCMGRQRFKARSLEQLANKVIGSYWQSEFNSDTGHFPIQNQLGALVDMSPEECMQTLYEEAEEQEEQP